MCEDKSKGLFVALSLVATLSLCGGKSAEAEVYTFDSPERWSTWEMPHGIMQVSDEGHLELTKFNKNINAAIDAPNFTHPTQQRGEVQGGIWNAGSQKTTAGRIIDGDVETYWKPNPGDDLVDWYIEIDLGRVVLAKEIRITFPDQEGARPFRQFSVFVATGARIQVKEDVFRYRLAYRTTQPNKDTVISFPVGVSMRDTTRVIDAGMEIDLDKENKHFATQFVRIVVDEQSPDAALAEVEVIADGDNVSLGILERGGAFSNGLLGREPQNMFDGSMDTFGNVFTTGQEGTWEEVGLWWEADLGALFWIEEIFLYFQTRGEALSYFVSDGFNYGTGYAMLYSDGKRTISGDVDYTPLLEQPQSSNSREGELRHFRYLFKPRKIRYLFWHGLLPSGWYSHPMELMLISSGYPAQVIVRSGFIDLGQISGDGRPKAIKSLVWDADLPPNTRMQLRSRSGSELREEYTFYDKKGDVLTQESWNSLPKVIRGEVDTSVVTGDDWGEWSNFYQVSGESFQSETPRRYVELEVILSSDDPQVAPTVRSLGIDFEDALVQEAKGRVLPRQAVPNEETQFIYTMWPGFDARDDGFNQVRLSIPNSVEEEEVEVFIGGEAVIPLSTKSEGDSLLFVSLPQKVVSDSVEVAFTTRVLRNATVFRVDLGNTDRPGLWQSVEAVERRANIVYLPELVDRDRLIDDLEISPVFTPNGDGINDMLKITFALFKVEDSQPTVQIFDLTGRKVADLGVGVAGNLQEFTWTGQDLAGEVVSPGVYICRIDAGAEYGEDTATRSVAVVY